MSTYVREKVLRIPIEDINYENFINIFQKKYPDQDVKDDIAYYFEKELPDLFGYGDINKFQFSPTYPRSFIDYVLEYEYDCDGDYGKVRELYDSEKEKFKSIFQRLYDDVDMNKVRLVEFCWYNGCEAPDYYEFKDDPFYKEL